TKRNLMTIMTMTKTSAFCRADRAVQVVNGMKRILTGLAVAVAVMFPHQDAKAAQAPVPLGSSATFAVLAATTVTSTGGATVNGDLGISPGSTLTGSPTVNGSTHLADSAAGQAQGDLTIAYNDAAGRPGGAAVA